MSAIYYCEIFSFYDHSLEYFARKNFPSCAFRMTRSKVSWASFRRILEMECLEKVRVRFRAKKSHSPTLMLDYSTVASNWGCLTSSLHNFTGRWLYEYGSFLPVYQRAPSAYSHPACQPRVPTYNAQKAPFKVSALFSLF